MTMEEQKEVAISPVPPLHKGRSFVCYRDVNRAIEKHRELFGLRLALKRAIKLENYCLTVEQMKDLNLRLKYGELDYHCFAATGRPGRPGNDERCPQLVRLKLSPDAQSLIVYESHNHDILPSTEGMAKPLPLLKQKTDMVTFSPDKPTYLKDFTLPPSHQFKLIQNNPVLIIPKPTQGVKEKVTLSGASCPPSNFMCNSNSSFTSLIPLTQSSSFSLPPPESDINSITITPIPPLPLYTPELRENENPEKLTLKIKKSQVVPNEMIVVGSSRDAQEQQRTKGKEELPCVKETETPKMSQSDSTPKEILPKPSPQSSQTPKQGAIPTTVSKIPSSSSLLKIGNPSKMVSSNPKVVNSKMNSKINSSGNHTGGRPIGVSKPGLGTSPKTSTPSGNICVKSPLNVSQKQNITPKPGSILTKPTVLKQSANMKQIIIKKSPQIGVGKPATAKLITTVKPLGDKSTNVPNQVKKLAPKPVQHPKITNSKVSLNTSSGKTPSVPSSELINKVGDRVKFKNGERPIMNSGDKSTLKNSDTYAIPKQALGVTTNGHSGTQSSTNGNRFLNIPKKLKRKPGRPPDSSTSSNSVLGSLDTELGFGEKQHLAHGVLLQLLRVTSQLPMVEFSHALDTLEVLTDAFRLGQRVTLSIRHDQEELDSYNDILNRSSRSEDKEFGVSSTTTEDSHTLLSAQVDGQLDVNELLKGLSSLNSSLPTRAEQQRQHQDELMDVEPPKDAVNGFVRNIVNQPIMKEPQGQGIRVLPSLSASLDHRRGLKRTICPSFSLGCEAKRSKF